MSIPGLGTLPATPVQPASQSHTLTAYSEYRISLPPYLSKPLILRLLSGTAERDGVELAPNTDYQFHGPLHTKIFTWTGCDLEIESNAEIVDAKSSGSGPSVMSMGDFIQFDPPESCPYMQYLNLHTVLEGERIAASKTLSPNFDREKESKLGPRVLIAGGAASGKTSLARMLTAWAVKTERSPVVINTNPGEGMLTLPGTVSAAVMATSMEVDTQAQWGVTPATGPSPVPVKLPLVQYYGRQNMKGNIELFKSVTSRLARNVSARMIRDEGVRTSGCIIDTAGVEADDHFSLSCLSHLIDEFSVNIVVVLAPNENSPLKEALGLCLADLKTSLNEEITIVELDIASGVVPRSESHLQLSRESSIRDYFFGDVRRNLSPFSQMMDFDSLVIWCNFLLQPTSGVDDLDKSPKKETEGLGQQVDIGIPQYQRLTDPLIELQEWCLAVMAAPHNAPGDEVQHASVLGFVYVSHVDIDRRKLRILAPMAGTMGDNPLLWGKWPDVCINLIG